MAPGNFSVPHLRYKPLGFCFRFQLRGSLELRIWVLLGWQPWASFYRKFKFCGIFASAEFWEVKLFLNRYILYIILILNFIESTILKVIFSIALKLSVNCSLCSPHVFWDIHVSVLFQFLGCQLDKWHQWFELSFECQIRIRTLYQIITCHNIKLKVDSKDEGNRQIIRFNFGFCLVPIVWFVSPLLISSIKYSGVDNLFLNLAKVIVHISVSSSWSYLCKFYVGKVVESIYQMLQSFTEIKVILVWYFFVWLIVF